ncbi:glutathione peroxidase [Arthrobacter livingstonensis]|uniref:Glutathione peroxidase n=1 Tax=Arthrobacter livingstonensis TaxID=670078 RepID=A0A2V5LHM4_9MICC|nr:glutathione peroxidase [Arthrobacter livingstonensis]PYI69573.1 glutathione peroxidase [Arthrobacter livingstonensis]
MATPTLQTISLILNDGTESSVSAIGGKAVLVVNVASKCGFTPQYDTLEALYEKYRAGGLEILGVPSNQFGGQEPGTDGEIADFCRRNFGVTFALTAKTDVNGPDAHPLYVALTKGGAEPIAWNFEKFLVNRDGVVLARFASSVSPDAPELVAAVEAALAAAQA